MGIPAESPKRDAAAEAVLKEDAPYVGLVTRTLSWGVDFLLINLAAIITGLGAQLVASIFPITKDLKPLFVAIAGAVYVLWSCAYFVAFWSVTGQTPGARLMQVRLMTASGEKVGPVRACVRWIGMIMALLPLPWGYVPIPFKRRGFPDWLAHTRVVEVEQLSVAAARLGPAASGRDRSQQPLHRSNGNYDSNLASGSGGSGPILRTPGIAEEQRTQTR